MTRASGSSVSGAPVARTRRVRGRARRRSAWVVALVLLASGCTYSHSEPGLFGTREPSVQPLPSPVAASPGPSHTGSGPAASTGLPVLGERT